MRRTLVLLILLVSVSIATKGQTTVNFINIDLTDIPQPTTASGLRYWFDDDASSLRETESLTGPVPPGRTTAGLLTSILRVQTSTAAGSSPRCLPQLLGEVLLLTAKYVLTVG